VSNQQTSTQRFYQYTFPNGLTLLCETMVGVQSAAMTLILPAGSAGDPAHRSGSATVLSELVLRGAGKRDSRQLTDYLDFLGLQRSSSVGVYHTRFSAAAPAERVMESLGVYSDIVRRPMLPESGFDAARDLALQNLAGIEDEPRQKLLITLREKHYPYPYGRNPMGEVADLKSLTLAEAKRDFQSRYVARGAILAMAGRVDFDEARRAVETHFGSFAGSTTDVPIQPTPPVSFIHQPQKSEQTHIGLAWPSVKETDDDYYTVRLAVEILAGGMSGRLFTEIREKRALVYSVWAGYTSLKESGSIMGYAGTSNDRAQATLDCFVAELFRLCDGVTASELDRAKTGVKANMIMQGESTSARCGAIAHDFFMRGRIRTLEEIKEKLDAVTVDQVNNYLNRHRPGPFTIVIVGPNALKPPEVR
jgi:predicted Zn-dependent peptidase